MFLGKTNKVCFTDISWCSMPGYTDKHPAPPRSFPQENRQSVARQISLAMHENSAAWRVSDKTCLPVENPPCIFISLTALASLNQKLQSAYLRMVVYIWMCAGIYDKVLDFRTHTYAFLWTEWMTLLGNVTLNAFSS